MRTTHGPDRGSAGGKAIRPVPVPAVPSTRDDAGGCRTCSASDEHDSWNTGVRKETPLQRADRAYGEILQEIRVAQTGVQILFAFLLTLAFTARFNTTTPVERDIYVVSLMLSAAAAALLIAPAAFHRMVYRRRLKQHLVRVADKLALAGLGFLLLAMISAVLLILDVVTGPGLAMVLSSVLLCWFFFWWFLLPVAIRVRHPLLTLVTDEETTPPQETRSLPCESTCSAPYCSPSWRSAGSSWGALATRPPGTRGGTPTGGRWPPGCVSWTVTWTACGRRRSSAPAGATDPPERKSLSRRMGNGGLGSGQSHDGLHTRS